MSLIDGILGFIAGIEDTVRSSDSLNRAELGAKRRVTTLRSTALLTTIKKGALFTDFKDAPFMSSEDSINESALSESGHVFNWREQGDSKSKVRSHLSIRQCRALEY
ncbi:hypothetical protein Ciccas_010577 [Cichlidogyrus casuarinus]|uniref:Uncharacterized protein n=1 Tax=Cichlidogyrus casuarinus TaxID=1844966 RepID=A0ABD2PTR6_9PLAT